MSFSDWKDVLVRSWKEAGDDNVGLIAAGVAFYAFLAMVPLLGAIVLSYGLVADPATVMSHVKSLTTVMPAARRTARGGPRPRGWRSGTGGRTCSPLPSSPGWSGRSRGT